jgi:hypothetical protein
MDPQRQSRPFRFFDNRQKYLLFVTTTTEKREVAERAGFEIAELAPEPPALSIFDAGMGDGSVLVRVLRELHHRFPTVPLRIVGKEISLEDVRLCLEKMPGRLAEHPTTVLVMTNLAYACAPGLRPKPEEFDRMIWNEVAFEGTTSFDFERQIAELSDFIAHGWETRTGERTGNPLYVRPTVLVLYRADHRFLLDRVVPRDPRRRGASELSYDLVLAAQPFRAAAPADFKIQNVLVPLARSLKVGGRMLIIQSTGEDPGMEIVRAVWPQTRPFATPREMLITQLRGALGIKPGGYDIVWQPEERYLFRYQLNALPGEMGHAIGTSTLLAAWNAAVYVAQIEDSYLEQAIASGAWVEATRNPRVLSVFDPASRCMRVQERGRWLKAERSEPGA